MNENDPITPPPELVQQWADMIATHTDTEVFSAAAQWGADQELEACEMYLAQSPYPSWAKDLRAARRPKPPSLKEQALDALKHLALGPDPTAFHADMDTIRRALEQLNG